MEFREEVKCGIIIKTPPYEYDMEICGDVLVLHVRYLPDDDDGFVEGMDITRETASKLEYILGYFSRTGKLLPESEKERCLAIARKVSRK